MIGRTITTSAFGLWPTPVKIEDPAVTGKVLGQYEVLAKLGAGGMDARDTPATIILNWTAGLGK